MAWHALSDLIHFRVGESQGRPAISLAGELDLLSARALRSVLRRHLVPDRPNVLDLSRVTFTDAAGLSILVQASREAQSLGAVIVLRKPSRSVRRLLDLSGTADLFTVEAPSWREPSSDVIEILGEAIRGAIRITGAFAGNAQLPDGSGGLRIVAHHGFDRSFLTHFESVEEGESACGTALATGGSVWVDDVTASPIFAGTPSLDVLLGAGARAVASLPIHAGDGRLAAVLSVHQPVRTTWTGDQKTLLRGHAQVAGHVLAAELA